MKCCKTCGVEIPDSPKTRTRCASCQRKFEGEYRSAYKKEYYKRKREERHAIAGLETFAYFVGYEHGADPDCRYFVGKYLPAGEVMKCQNGFLPEGLLIKINGALYRVFLKKLEKIRRDDATTQQIGFLPEGLDVDIDGKLYRVSYGRLVPA